MKKKKDMSRMQGHYKGFTLVQVATRPNCLWMLQYPSRFSNLLIYPNEQQTECERKTAPSEC